MEGRMLWHMGTALLTLPDLLVMGTQACGGQHQRYAAADLDQLPGGYLNLFVVRVSSDTADSMSIQDAMRLPSGAWAFKARAKGAQRSGCAPRS
jgi:hypothetical protein